MNTGFIGKLERWLERIRERRWFLLLASLAFLLLAIGGTFGLLLADRQDLANVLLAIAVLAVAIVTLLVTVPAPARLHFEKEDRPQSPDDLVFYLWSNPSAPGVQWPRDFTLNLDIVVINVGGRKTVLSHLGLIEFLGATDQKIVPHTLPMPLYATLIRQRRGFVSTGGIGGLHFQTDQEPGPWVIGPDEAITLRLRWRGGINWSAPRWNLEETGRLAASLEHAITKARIEGIYRRGREKTTEEFVVSVNVQAQALYRSKLLELTQDLTTMPANIPLQHLQFPTGDFE